MIYNNVNIFLQIKLVYKISGDSCHQIIKEMWNLGIHLS